MDRDYSSFDDYEFPTPPAIYRELYPVHLKYAKSTGAASSSSSRSSRRHISSADLASVVVTQPHSCGGGGGRKPPATTAAGASGTVRSPLPASSPATAPVPASTSTATGTTGGRSLSGFESLIPVQSVKLTFSELNDCCPEICIKNIHGELLFKGRFAGNFCSSCCQCHAEDREVFINDLNEQHLSRLVFHSPPCRCFEETDFYEVFAPVRERVGTVTYHYNRGEQTFVIKNEISTEEYTVRRSIGENAHIKTVKGDVIAVLDVNRPGRNIRPSYTLTFTHHAVTLVDKILLIGFLIAVDVLYLETTFIFQCIFIPCFSFAFALLVCLILYYKLAVAS